MQILAIRGANLASLAEPFDIDLTAEPLASCGLFAITGETGAGKSTILDAMCLALYGDCPRLSNSGINDDIPDAGGEAIKSRDARAILRRGASRGFAEVDFLAPDGVTYRASWGARRARDKADGRLQNVDRALVRLSDEQVLESQISAVNARVAEITGLAYDEFRRTVLLAQGDFDAFLVAGTGERAALLEKVTGTRIYRDISRRIYARHEQAKADLKALEDRRSGSTALTDDARTELTEERTRLQAEIATLGETITAQAAKIATHEAVTAARGRVERAKGAETKAKEAVEASRGDRDKLAGLETAIGLRTEHDRARRASGALSEQETAEAAAAERQAELAEAETGAKTAQDTAVAALEEAERIFKAFGPDWTKATDLDGRIRTAAEEHSKAEAAHTEAAGEATTAQSALDTLLRERDGHTGARDAAETELAKTPEAHRLVDGWETVSGLIDERIRVTDALREKRAEAKTARERSATAGTRLEELDGEDRADREAIAELDATAGTARDRLAEIGRSDPATRMARLVEGDTAVKAMIAAAGTHDQVQRDREKALAELATQETAREAADTEARAAETETARATAAIEALEEPAGRAAAAASEQAAHLRRHLAEGEPCPVCGATEHPVSADEALAGVARDMRARLQAERDALQTATRAGTGAARKAEAARLAITTATEARDTADRRIAEAASAFAEARETAAGTGLEGLPETPAGAAAALDDLRGRLETRRREISGLAEEESRLRRELDRDQGKAAERRAAIEARAATRREQEEARNTAGTAAGLADQAATQAAERLETIDGQLAPVLAGIDRTPGIFDDQPEEKRAVLERIVTWMREQRAARDAAAEALSDLAPRISAAETTRDTAARAADRARETMETRGRALSDLRAERGELLGGEETEAHRTRHNQARIDAQETRDARAKALSTASGDRAGADERLAGLRESLAAARTEDAEARADLEGKLAKAGMDRERLDALLAEGRPEAERLRATIKEIDDVLTSAKATTREREADLQALIDAGLPEEPEAELRAAKGQAETTRTEKQERAGAIQGQLSADDAVRAQQKDLDREIAAAGDVRDTWAAVNEAVGSASGGKFAQIAQGVTLAMLVERANQHLADLKPRYRLVRGGADLALRIVDRDMGDEERSTRSLSGGERFLVSLSLALALSRMGGHGGLAATLFIDEGFGSLDAESLDVAIDALEALQAQGRTIGVISHVDAMKDRISVQVRVTRRGAGASGVDLTAA